MKPLSRRTLLRGLGGLGLSLPFLDAMLPVGRSGRAHAATVPPRRIVFVLTPGGFHMDRWKCALGSATESRTVALSPILSELEPIRDLCLFVEGVPMTSAEDTRTCAAGHPQGTSAVFTGAFAGPGTMYGGNQTCTVGPPEFESVDGLLARHVGNAVRFPALHVGAMVQNNAVAKRCFFGPGQTLISPQGDPAKVFQTLFGNFTQPSPDTGAARLEEQRLLLDGVQAELSALRCKLGSEDRQRLDRHTEEVRSLSARLGLDAPRPSACVKPAAPTGLSATTFSQLPQVLTAQLDLVAMALACDLTRVVGVQIHAPDMDSNGVYSWLGHDINWHLVTHLEGTDPYGRLEQANRWQAKQLLYLVRKLQALQEADGSSVMDNTVIVWGSEVGRGWIHDPRDVAWTLIGKGQGYFDTGKYVKFAGNSSTRHNRLLAHFAQYFGLPSTNVGHPDYHAAPLASLAR